MRLRNRLNELLEENARGRFRHAVVRQHPERTSPGFLRQCIHHALIRQQEHADVQSLFRSRDLLPQQLQPVFGRHEEGKDPRAIAEALDPGRHENAAGSGRSADGFAAASPRHRVSVRRLHPFAVGRYLVVLAQIGSGHIRRTDLHRIFQIGFDRLAGPVGRAGDDNGLVDHEILHVHAGVLYGRLHHAHFDPGAGQTLQDRPLGRGVQWHRQNATDSCARRFAKLESSNFVAQ
jgi:hypothetical protein